MLTLYPVTLFLSAALMFLVQPMFGKMALPLLGGSPAVWNTQVVFCQGVLLFGYLYAHLTSRWLGIRRQVLIQCFLIFFPLLLLPIGIPQGQIPPGDVNPIFWLLSLLLVTLGLPFFVVAPSARCFKSGFRPPVIQRQETPISSMQPATQEVWWVFSAIHYSLSPTFICRTKPGCGEWDTGS